MIDLEQIGYFLYMEQCEREQQEKEKQDTRLPLNDEEED